MAARAFCRVCMVSQTSAWLTGEGLAWVPFADHRPPSGRAAGGYDGAYWFCSRHVDAARALQGRSSEAALASLARRFGPSPDAIREVLEIWIDDLGSADRVGVMKCVREGTDLSPREVAERVRTLPTRIVAHDWRSDGGQDDALLRMTQVLRRMGVKLRIEEV